MVLDQKLISYRYSSGSSRSCCPSYWGDLYKKAYGSQSVVTNGIGMKFGTIVLQNTKHRFTESDF